MADQVFGMQPSKEDAGKLYSSTVDKVTIGLPANAFLVVVPLMAFLIYILKSGYFDKLKASMSITTNQDFDQNYPDAVLC